ncbi:MAG: YihY/virulence factor BrkB family protein [Nitrospirae bacterium]|jgi:membrane protein|nr:YihY/virulence factor BrkB family protein [Nitrospirota bacterium]
MFKFIKIISRSLVDFFRDNGIMLAGSISYFAMMAMVPFCLFLITVLGYVLGKYHGFYDFFSHRLIEFFPEITSGIIKELNKLISYKVLGSLSLLLYGFLSIQVFASLENALNIIFKVKKKRSFFWSVIFSIIMITFVIITVFVSFTATSLIPLLKTLKHVFPTLRIGLITALLIRYIVPFITVLLAVTIMYLFFPKSKVRIKHALSGALFTTLLLEIAKHIFTWYVGTVVKFGTIYGPLSAFIVFLLWVFYSSCIFLIGAEIVHNLNPSKK